jgi:hypothetical protein
MEGSLKRILLAAALLGLLIPAAIAQAEAVQEFSYQVKDVKPDGRYTVVFSSRTYDTTGNIPPPLRENYQRLPAGAELNKAVRNKKYQCNVDKLLDDLLFAPENNVLFARRVDKLSATIKRVKSRWNKKQRRNAEVCAAARIGQGTAQVDARPLFSELIPSVFYMFLGKGTVPGAVASLQILGMPDETTDVVKRLPTTVQTTRVPFIGNFVNQPTPDGKYGYKLVLPTGPIQGINISLAEIKATVKGLTITKKKTSCQKKRRGKCVKKKVKKTKVFWFTQPKCPPSGKLSFESYYGYDDPQPDITKTIELSCPNFKG